MTCYGIPLSGMPSIADIRAIGRQVRFVPIPDSCTAASSVFIQIISSAMERISDYFLRGSSAGLT